MITLVDSVDVEVALPSLYTLEVFDHEGDAEKIAVLRARGRWERFRWRSVR
jgi:hypothetical protein